MPTNVDDAVTHQVKDVSPAEAVGRSEIEGDQMNRTPNALSSLAESDPTAGNAATEPAQSMASATVNDSLSGENKQDFDSAESAASATANNGSKPTQDLKSTTLPVSSTVTPDTKQDSDSTESAASATANNGSKLSQDLKSTTLPVLLTVTPLPVPLLFLFQATESLASLTPTKPPASPVILNDSGAMDVDTLGATTEPTSQLDAMEVDKEKAEVHTPSSANISMVEALAWLTALNMDVFLQDCSDVKAWQGLVQSLYMFEALNTINRVHRYSFSTLGSCFQYILVFTSQTQML